jgi:hypothetical protein
VGEPVAELVVEEVGESDRVPVLVPVGVAVEERESVEVEESDAALEGVFEGVSVPVGVGVTGGVGMGVTEGVFVPDEVCVHVGVGVTEGVPVGDRLEVGV